MSPRPKAEITTVTQMKTRQNSHSFRPFSVLALITTKDPTRNFLITLNQEAASIFTTLVAGLFEDKDEREEITVSTLGQTYTTEQLTGQNILKTFGSLVARRTAQLPTTESAADTYPLNHSQKLSRSQRKTLFPKPEFLRSDTEEKFLYLRAVHFPCALIGPERTLKSFSQTKGSSPVQPHGEETPAFRELRTFLTSKLHVKEEDLFLVAPVSLEAAKEAIETAREATEIACRRLLDLEEAKHLALSSPAPVIAATAFYGKGNAITYLSLAIQRADTLEVLKTYVYPTSDFPSGSQEAREFLDDLTFAWGAKEHHILAGLVPEHKEAGKLVTLHHTYETFTPHPNTCVPERRH